MYWDTTTDGDGVLGGGGTWNLSNLFWDLTGTDPAAPLDNVAWPNASTNAIGVFQGTAGAVILNNGGATTNANGLTFNVSGYTITSNAAGDSLTLVGTTPTISVTNAGHFARIDSVLAGAAGLTVAGSGNLILGGANTFTGQTIVGAGSTLTLNNIAALGANGAGNETIVSSGGTLNLGGQGVASTGGNPIPRDAVAEEFRISGTGVGGIGALINSGASQLNAVGKLVLTGDATVNAGGGLSVSYAPSGQIVNNTGAAGRFDVRRSNAPTAGDKTLDLANFTLTKKGQSLFAIVNAEVTSGDIVVDEGQLNIEGGSLVQGTGTITVNPNGKLGFWQVGSTGTNITRSIVVNGGTIGDPTNTGAAQVVGSPISITGSQNPNFSAVSGNGTTLAGVISQSGFTGTAIEKRGGGLLTFSNTGNNFSAPIIIYGGTLRADYTTTLSGGVPPTTALTSTDTPLGSNPTITLAGGTLGIRANMDNNNTNQVFDIQKNIVVDMAPGGMAFDRIGNGSQTDKHVRITSLTMMPSSASNNFSIGQNQLTFTQGNTHRLEIPLLTMGSDTALATGDFTLSGNILSAGKNSLVHTAANTLQFIAPGTHEFNAFFNAAGTLRVGNGFGTPVTNNNVTVGTGTVYMAPGTTGNWRSATNIAADQVIDATVSQRLSIPVLNFEQFTDVPSALRATGSGIYGIGNATYGNIDLSKLGDGTWRIGSNFTGTGNGTINGVISSGANGTIRMGGGGTAVVTGVNAVTGTSKLEIGAELLNNAQPNSSTGTVLLSNSNDFTGGTVVNRGSTLRFQSNSLGSGPVIIGGTATAESAGNSGPHGTFIGSGTATILGGSTIRFVNDAITSNATATPDRWGDTTPIKLAGSTVEMRARNIASVASDTIETVGAMTVTGGSFISLQRLQTEQSGHNVQLTVDSLTRQNQGTLELARNTGNGAGYGGGQKFVVTNGAPTVTNGMVAPWIVAQNNGPTDFMTYNAVTGFGVVSYNNSINTGTYAAGALNYDGTAGGKVQVTAVDLALQDNPIMYALKSERTINNNGANNTITLRSGGLNLRNLADNTTVTINPAVIANDGTNNVELLVNTTGGGTGRNYQIAGAVTANGLTKFGAGNLILAAANPNLTGTVAVNAGTLELRAATAATLAIAGNGSIRLQGGQLNVRGAAGNYTLTNGLTVTENIPVATVDSNRTDTSSTGTATFNPAASGPGLVLEGSAGSQGQTLNVSGANYGVTFGNNALNTFNGNVTINNAVTLTLNNNPTINGTNPVITKAGTGNWIVGPTGGTRTVSNGTKVVLNEGTLELRSVIAFGTGATTTLDLNRGTLNLRRDTTGKYGTAGSGAGYAVNVNGSTTISVDRAGGSNTNQQISIGKLTMQTNGTLTVNNGNGFGLGVEGAEFKGTAIIISNANSASATSVPANPNATGQEAALRFLSGFDVSGGALVKLGGGQLHLLNADNSYSGGTYIHQGTVSARATNALGTGSVYLNQGGNIDFDSATNLRTGQQLIVSGNGAYFPMISVNANGVSHPTANVNTTNAPVGIVGLSNGPGVSPLNGVYDDTINLSTLYGGGWSLGGVGTAAYDPVYTGPSIVAGNGNLYRLGGGGTSFSMGTDAARVARTDVLTGPNDVRLGFDSGNILVANSTNFQFSIAGTNNYSGGETVIHRGMVARLFSANNGTHSGLSNSAVDVFGVLSLSGSSTLANGSGNTNAVTFHPGSALFFDNNGGAANGTGAFAAANVSNRWDDSTPITLNSAAINYIGATDALSTETVGDVTFSGGSRIRSARSGTTGTTVLTLGNLNAASGPGHTLQLQANSLGGTNAAGGSVAVIDLIKVAGTAPTVTNGMVSSAIVNATDNTFVTYNGTNGFANVVYDKSVNATYAAGSLLPTDKVDVVTGALTLTDNPTVYALRTSQSINVGGPFNTITIRSGGLIGTGGTINPNLVFNDGTSNVEARIYVNGTLNINGTITANGITKFGHNGTVGGAAGILAINAPQPDYASGWTVNSGSLQINDPRGLGQSVPGNSVTLNGTLTTGGRARMDYAQTQLNFNFDSGTPETTVFSGGPITVINEATIRMGGGVDNKSYQIPNVTLDSTDTDSRVSLTVDVPNNRTRGTIPTLTLNDNAIVRVTDAGSTADTGRSVAAVVNTLTGTNKELTKIGNRTLELPGDNSGTFSGGSITVSQGTVRVRNNGSLGSATTVATIERNSTLEIDTTNFTPVGTVNQLAGSIERWNREDARGTTYNLPAGVNLQLNTNLLAARTVGLNGGTIEGFLWTDHPAPAVERTIGSAVTVNLLANSSVGQNVLQGQGYDAGRQPSVGNPFGDNNTGAFLRIEGKITGDFDLTKTGLDTVIIAGTENTYGNTLVDSGTLRLGASDALPTNRTLTTRLNGVLDLYGNNQTVTGLGTPTGGANPGGVSVGSSGKITNSSPVDKTLTVNNSTNYTYNGVIDRNVALTKKGTGSLTLGGANKYVGDTVIEAGTLILTGSISGSSEINVHSGATFDVSGVVGGPYVLEPAQTLAGGGTILGPLVVEGTVSPGASAGQLLVDGALTFSAGSTLTLEIAGPNAGSSYDQVSVSATGGPITLNGGNVSLSLSYQPVQGTSYTVINNLAATQIGGAFSNLPDGGVITVMFNGAPWDFVADYQGGDGNDLVLTVPEPTSLTALAVGMGLCAGLRRFRRRSASV